MSLLHKNLAVAELDLKFNDENRGFFSGYASKFNGVDAYKDTIAPGAYSKTLQERDRPVQMRWNHYGDVIGKWTTIREDSYGLYVEGELTPGHSKAEDVYALMKHGAITGMSIGFRIGDSEKKDDGGRLLKEIDLVEISIVETPADLGAQMTSVKAALDEAVTLKELESLLRDAGGFSKSEATAIIAKARAIGLGEPDQGKTVGNTSDDVKRAFNFVANPLNFDL